MASPVLQIRMPDALHAALRDEAERLGTEPSVLARTFIARCLSANALAAKTSARAVETDAPGELTIDPNQDFGA